MYEVIVSPEADSDLDRIVQYIAVELGNPPAAAALADKIDARLIELETMPESPPFAKASFGAGASRSRIASNRLMRPRVVALANENGEAVS